MDNKVWEFPPQDEDLKSDLAGKLAISPLVASLLINRGISDARTGRIFLNPDFSNLADPFDLSPGMETAAARVGKALQNKEPILVYGDYDADGVTATALLTLFLRDADHPVVTFIPHRVDDGYGLHFNPLREAKRKSGAGLVISVDCGIGAAAVVEQAKEINLDVIITDHHLPADQVPQGVPLVNPHLGRKEEFKSLSGVGVAFELIRAVALLQHGNGLCFSQERAGEYLDLVAAGTVADLSPLRGESRILTRLGLEMLNRSPRPAFRELFCQAGVKAGHVDTQTLGWIVGPRINAAGRLSDADLALSLFLTDSESERASIAQKLEQGNRQRQQVQQKVLKAVCRKIEEENLAEHSVIILGDQDWHPGVVGIVAGKVAERYHRPVIIFGITKHLAKGSGRSVSNFDLFEAVKSCASLLTSFGGHQKAVGVGILPEQLDEFRQKMEGLAEKRLKVEEAGEQVRIDAQFELSKLTPDVVREMELLAPFGQENPAPVLASFGLEVAQMFSRVVGVGKNHLKLWLKHGAVFRQAIYFGMAKLHASLPAGILVDVAYTPKLSGEDGVNCIEFVELEIKGLRESVAP